MSVMFPNKVWGTWVSANSPVVERLLSFAQLPEGWHYGQGLPANRSAIKNALDVRKHLISMGVKKTKFEVFPKVDGSVVISAFGENVAVDVICHGKGRFDVLIEVNEAEVFDEENIDLSELLTKMRLFEWREMSRSGYSTLYTTRGSATDSTAWQPVSQATASRLLTSRVHVGVAAPNAVTYHFSTKNTSVVTPQCSFDSYRQNTRTQRSSKIQQPQEILAIS